MILIIGCGKTGIGAGKYFAAQNKEVIFFDEKTENLENTKKNINFDATFINKIEDLSNFSIDFAVCSPGFRTKYNPIQIINYLNSAKITIKSDIDVMLDDLNPSQKVVAITGTNGKSTTTALLAHTLSELGKTSIACGNIGLAVLDFDFKQYEYLCLETSSSQFEISQNPRFYAGILTNISNDHIEYHGSFDAYVNAKNRVFSKNIHSFASIEDGFCKKITSGNEKINKVSNTEITQSGISFFNGNFYKNGEKLTLDSKQMQIIGNHNIQNALFVLNFCEKEGFNISKTFDAICSFQALKHRLQLVRNIGNIAFINDSKATNIDSTKVALAPLDEIYLIAGGVAKYPHSILDLSQFFSKIKHFFLIGEAASEFFDDIKSENKTIYNSMEDAIKSAYKLAISNIKNKKSHAPKILLSPLCASFDMYKNFEERGDDFINIVQKL